MFDHLVRYLGCTLDEVRDLLDRVGLPTLRLCADLGHAHLLPGGVTGFLHVAEGLIAHVQLTDNNGTTDSHLPIGTGTLPVAEMLAELGPGAGTGGGEVCFEARSTGCEAVPPSPGGTSTIGLL